ncbi:hypothetical protein [uncultured Tenacibaculum sp.]|uniref:hypothetical protein n=1 Tax=uncultured Tenacibaculum sp. TaxID=174713 RepID=UPI002618948E|nr:hypothetical protein [uncultured Tenacibaculum sp.]
MRKLLTILVGLCVCLGIKAQAPAKNVEAIKNKILDVSFLRSLDSTEAKTYEKDVLPFLNYLIKNKKDLNKIQSKISFGLRGNDNYKHQSRYDFSSGFELTSGYYPHRLSFKAFLSTQFFNGTLQENISDFKVKLNYHFNERDEHMEKGEIEVKDNLSTEGYVYADRYSNQYLGIQQRYEIGSGFIFNWYSSQKVKQKKIDGVVGYTYPKKYFRGLTKEGIEKMKSLYLKPSIAIDMDKSNIKICKKGTCPKPVRLYKGTHAKDSLMLEKEYSRLANSLKKKYSSFRVATQLGVFYEIEKGIAKDSIEQNQVLTEVTRNIETTDFLRWTVRPILEFKTDLFSASLKPALKMPMPWNWNSIVRSENMQNKIDKRLDYLVDVELRMTYSISNKFDINFELRHIYDNAPKRVYLDDLIDIPLLSAESNHTFFNFTLSYKI